MRLQYKVELGWEGEEESGQPYHSWLWPNGLLLWDGK